MPRQSPQRLAATPPETAVNVTPQSDNQVSAAIDAPAPANLLTGTSLKIQAISWSQAPQDRIAVVSSQVVREGQTIEGYRVKRINTEDLILSKEGLDWILAFEHR
jgi:type II secretory pathway component PulC